MANTPQPVNVRFDYATVAQDLETITVRYSDGKTVVRDGGIYTNAQGSRCTGVAAYLYGNQVFDSLEDARTWVLYQEGLAHRPPGV